MRSRISIVVIALLAFTGIACDALFSKHTKTAVDAGCELLRVFPGTEDEQALCATAADLLDIATMIRSARADASDPISRFTTKSARCRIVPGQTLCATDDELAWAIRELHARKSS